MFSPAAKAGLQEGDIFVQINGWKIETMDNNQVAVNLFLAAGYQVAVGWLKVQPENYSNVADWDQLDLL